MIVLLTTLLDSEKNILHNTIVSVFFCGLFAC